MRTPIYLRKEPYGSGAYLHDAYDKHLGYISRLETAEQIVAAVNAPKLLALTTIDGAQIPNADEPFDFGRGFTIAREVIHPDIKAGQNVRGRTSDDEPWSYGTATVDGRCLLDRSEP